MKIKNNILKTFLLFVLIFAGANIQSNAENIPVSPENNIQTEVENPNKKLQLKDPIVDEMSEQEQKKALEEAKIKDELNNVQKTMGQAPPPKVEDKDFNPNANDKITQNVIPNTNTELMKLISMFARVMLAVLAASFIIYLLLLFTKKFFHPDLPEKSEENFDIRDLASPKNSDEALKSFLERTDD